MFQPADFYSQKPPPRIIGTETECNIQSLEEIEFHKYISGKAIKASGLTNCNDFLSNGMRIYPDVGQLEIASAESLGPSQASHADAASLDVLASIVTASGLEHRGLHSNSATNIKGKIATRGRHENYMIPRELEDDSKLNTLLTSFLASAIFKMAGTVRNGFQLSQKINGIGGTPDLRWNNSRTNHGKKPMAMIPPVLEDGDTMGLPEWARLEVRFADTLYSPLARYLGFAATSLVLRLIEHSDKLDISPLLQLSFPNPAFSARIFSKDLTFSVKQYTQDRRSISAIDYQEAVASHAAMLTEKVELPADEVKAIELWLDTLDDLRASNLEKDEYDRIITKLDFVPRYRFIKRHVGENPISMDDEQTVVSNLVWDRLLPDGGRSKYWDKLSSPFEDKIERSRLATEAPATRAEVRAKFIQDPKIILDMISWSFAYINGKEYSLGNPYGRNWR